MSTNKELRAAADRLLNEYHVNAEYPKSQFAEDIKLVASSTLSRLTEGEDGAHICSYVADGGPCVVCGRTVAQSLSPNGGNPSHVHSKATEETGLLPCPFCGSVGVVVEILSAHLIFHCVSCGADTWFKNTDDRADERWNRRVQGSGVPSSHEASGQKVSKEPNDSPTKPTDEGNPKGVK